MHKTNIKQVTVHPHHAVPYRKRHIGLLLVCLTGLLTLGIVTLQYRDQIITGMAGSRNFVSDMFQPRQFADTTITSSNGFSLAVDQRKLYVVASDGLSGALYQGDTLSQPRAYGKVQIATMTSPQLAENQSALTITYHSDISKAMTGNELSVLALGDAGIDRKNLDFVMSQQATIGDRQFEQGIWTTKKTTGPVKNVQASFSTYTAQINGHPMTIVVSEGVTTDPGLHPQFDQVIKSIRFDGSVAVLAPSQTTVAGTHTSLSVLDTLMMANVASAATTSVTGDSEKIAALYGPAVAKIYNLYCTDLTVNGVSFASNVCSGGSGSGFFVGQNGYFASNGHVASFDAKDLAIYYAYMDLYYTGSSDRLEYLMGLANVNDVDLGDTTNAEETADKLTDQLYGIADTKFELKNDVQNLFVVLGDKQPDAKELADDTLNRQKYVLDPTWIPASLVASDYRMTDGIKSYHASDVAILKVEGNNFPIVHLGSIDDVTQGANMSILGFPGNASENGIVDSKTSTATLTTGKVSSKKNASGSDKKLIETDTTIGHGNSGGPAFSDNGDVIGIATYTSDGSGKGDGVYNYVRDIKDLKDLAAAKAITFDTNSKTQSEWELGMANFYTSHYSKALKNFEQVKQLYPNHNKVAEFIATAQKRIANGEDVVDFPIIPAIIAGIVLIVGAGAGIFMVIRHKKHHTVYAAGVAQGTVSPMARSDTAQTVAVTHGPVVQTVVPAASAPTEQTPTVTPPDAQAPERQPVAAPPSEPIAVQPAPYVPPQTAAPEPVFATEQPAAVPTPAAAEPLFVEPVIAAVPRDPAPFSVPSRDSSGFQSNQSSAQDQSYARSWQRRP